MDGDRGWGWITRVGKHTVLHAGGAITTMIPNLWQDNFLTAAIPFAFAPYITALPGVAVPFHEYVCAGESADRIQRAGAADFRDGQNPGCSGEYRD